MKFEVRNVCRSFGKVKALDNVSFDFDGGGIIGFIGPNGAGKTTLLQIIAGLDEPDSGDVIFDGISVVDYPDEMRSKVGFMPDALPDAANISVQEYLEFFAGAFKLPDPQKSLREAMEFTKCDSFSSRRLAGLSKGMKQRVALARLLIHDPQLLLMDEPAAGLDPAARIELRDMLLTLAARGKTIFLSSHILAELEDIISGAVIIADGKICSCGNIIKMAENSGGNAGEELLEETLELTAYSGEPETFLPVLKAFPGVKSASVEGKKVFLVVECAAYKEFMSALGASDFPLASLVRLDRKIALEKIFLQVTRKGN